MTVIFEHFVCGIIRTQNFVCIKITFTSRAIPVSAKGSANYESVDVGLMVV